MDNLKAEKVFVEKGELLAALYDADAITMKGVKIINQFPSADVAPVRHGRWIEPTRLYYGAKQYEDTGFTPEQISDLLCEDTIQAAVTIRDMVNNGEFEILQYLADCYNDGRLVVLPCRSDAELTRDGHKFKADHWNHSLTAFRDAPETKSGKQVDLFSIEEAEAALTSMERKEGAE